jgi:MFS transporter, DHA2 family, multidrug resistance protein
MQTNAQPPRAGRREWTGLAVLALPCVLLTMDLTVLYLAVPSLARDLHPSSAELLWITDVYGFLIAGSLITMGTLGDRIGRRRLLLAGGAAFALASVLAAFATSAGMLIAARAVLGIAGATLMPSTLSLIRNLFADPHQRTIAIGAWGTSLSLGAAIGPLVGGVLLERFWWGSVFLLAVPVMALLLVLGPRLLPESRDPAPGRFDLPGAGLSLVAVLSAIYGLKQLAVHGIAPAPALALAAGLLAGAIFLRRQRRLADPLVDLELFRSPAFSVALASNALTVFAILGTELFIARYLQTELGMSPLEAGLWTLPSSAGIVAGSTVAPALAQRFRPPAVIATGLALAAGGFVILAIDGLGALATGYALLSVGVALVVTLSTDAIVGAAPAERAGAASALSETSTELGGALGIALLGSIGAAVYHSDLGDGLQLAALISAGLLAAMAVAARVLLGRGSVPGRVAGDEPCGAAGIARPADAAA